MRQTHGLEKICPQHAEFRSAAKLAEILVADLQNCHCYIYGTLDNAEQALLAELSLLDDSLNYDQFDQRIDLIVAGSIVRNDCVPLTYRLQGNEFAISGRCSMIPRVCGVDLYLQHSYTGQIGDVARQKFSIPIKPLLELVKPR